MEIEWRVLNSRRSKYISLPLYTPPTPSSSSHLTTIFHPAFNQSNVNRYWGNRSPAGHSTGPWSSTVSCSAALPPPPPPTPPPHTPPRSDSTGQLQQRIPNTPCSQTPCLLPRVFTGEGGRGRGGGGGGREEVGGGSASG